MMNETMDMTIIKFLFFQRGDSTGPFFRRNLLRLWFVFSFRYGYHVDAVVSIAMRWGTACLWSVQARESRMWRDLRMEVRRLSGS